ncbi:MAG: glycosyl transferase, partial [Chloroflexi bacterium]|nr:glycosyl transferase [Chloroflexota bacterium]
RDAVQATGAVVRRYEAQAITSLDDLMATFVDQTQQVLPQVLDQIREDRPDVVVYDALCLWALIATRLCPAPVIGLRPTYAFGQLDLARLARRIPPERRTEMQALQRDMAARLAAISAQYGLPPMSLLDLVSDSAPLTIIFLTREFQPGGEHLGDRYLFVGPSIRERQGWSGFPFERLDPSRPLVYLSLGTIFNNRPDLIRTCFDALGDGAYQVVAALGRRLDRKLLGSIPPRFVLAEHAPQLELLARARAFITHAGMNSTMEALYYGVPMVALPQMPEQAMTAHRIAKLGVGVELDPGTLTVEALREAVSSAVNDPGVRQRVRALQERTRAAGGYRRAADAIVNVATGGIEP